jgi:hypothetical protein
VKEFEGKKSIYLSTANAFGGTNTFLGVAFLTIAGIVALIMMVFVCFECAYKNSPNRYGLSHMSW